MCTLCRSPWSTAHPLHNSLPLLSLLPVTLLFASSSLSCLFFSLLLLFFLLSDCLSQVPTPIRPFILLLSHSPNKPLSLTLFHVVHFLSDIPWQGPLKDTHYHLSFYLSFHWCWNFIGSPAVWSGHAGTLPAYSTCNRSVVFYLRQICFLSHWRILPSIQYQWLYLWWGWPRLTIPLDVRLHFLSIVLSSLSGFSCIMLLFCV